MKKLHLGCGKHYMEGFVNLDFNKDVKTDVCVDINKKKLPFPDNTFDYVYTHHVLEHLDDLFKVMDEIWRVCKPGAIIDIYVPHFTSIVASKYPDHKQQFGIDSFRLFSEKIPFTKERYGKARFKVLKQELSFTFRNPGNKEYRWLKFVNFLNPFFNISESWQLIMERFFFPGFDEIYYKLKVFK